MFPIDPEAAAIISAWFAVEQRPRRPEAKPEILGCLTQGSRGEFFRKSDVEKGTNESASHGPTSSKSSREAYPHVNPDGLNPSNRRSIRQSAHDSGENSSTARRRRKLRFGVGAFRLLTPSTSAKYGSAIKPCESSMSPSMLADGRAHRMERVAVLDAHDRPGLAAGGKHSHSSGTAPCVVPSGYGWT